MKKPQYLLASLLFFLISCALGAFLVFGAPQENVALSQTQMARNEYNSTYGANQISILAQIATTPQSNVGLSLTQIERAKYISTYGAEQVVISTSTGKQLPFVNLTSLTKGDVLKYSTTGEEWINTEGEFTIDDNNSLDIHKISGSTLTGRLNIYDDGVSGTYLANLVVDDANVYALGVTNRTYSTTTPSFLYYPENDGDFRQGVTGDKDLIFFTSGYAGIRLTLDSSSATFTVPLVLPAYTRSITIPANSAVLGPTAPQATTIGTYRGLAFDADAETVNLTFEVPDDWNGTSDMTLKIYWSNEPGDALANTETVKWDFTYRVTAEGEDLDAGTVGSGTGTYTQDGAGTDGELIETEITLQYNETNQGLVVDSVVGILLDRDMGGDSYTGDAIVIQWEIDYTSIGVPVHD